MSGFPSSARNISCWLPRSRRSPAEARLHLERLLAEVVGGERFIDAGLLLVSELVTNAVVHGSPRDNRVLLALSADSARLRIEVHDARGDRAPVLRDAGRDAGGDVGEDDESGRGLLLVKSLSEKWGCCPRSGVGKIVWCEIGPEGAA
ncbi:ATP-binding protein [Kitasatospora sp. NPDC097605]|uniref:ATP-binding protein n=1 Tax=Kitasatospora sp. NPDC097605 TaxID=3157226 RepID=UPI003321633E